jgi:hypothetical protein
MTDDDVSLLGATASAVSPRRLLIANVLLVLTPLLAFGLLLLGYERVSALPEAPTGDTYFAWAPAMLIIFGGPVALVLLKNEAVRLPAACRDGSAVTLATRGARQWGIFFLALFVIFPAWGGTEGYPTVPTALVVTTLALVLPLTMPFFACYLIGGMPSRLVAEYLAFAMAFVAIVAFVWLHGGSGG